MQTNDNEYFRSAVTDEWNTPRPLTGQEQAEEQKQQTFRTKRHKTAQRAFSLAAPVAVVAVAATLVTTVAGPVCPVCGEEACHYFQSGRTGQFLTKEDLTPVTLAEPMTDTSLTWNGITVDGQFSEDKNEWDYFYTLTMENGQIAYLWEKNLYYLISERDVEYDNAFTVKRVQADVSPGENQYVGYAGEKEQNLQFYVQMVYLPDGSTPEEYTDQGDPSLIESVGRPHTYAVREVGTEGLWLQAYSFTDSLTPEEMLDAMKPVVLPAPQTDMELGSGMLMRWTDGMLERFYRDESVYHTSTLTLADGSDITVSCTSRLDTTSYEFHLKGSDVEEARFILRYTLYDWNEVQQAWARVYDQAAPTGHIGISTSIELQPVTVNDIVYRVYMNPKLREVGQKMSAYTLFFVPENQPTLMIEINADVIDEKMMEGASLEDVVWGENWKNILSRIYPLGSEPEAVPTPTPTPEPTPTPTPAPTGEETDDSIALSTEFPYALPDMHLANVGSYTREQVAEANRVSSLVSPGAAQTVVAVRKAFETQTDTSSGNAVVTLAEEPYTNTELYAWLDGDGTLNWYRDTNGLGVDAYAVIRPEGISYRYEWTAEGPVSYTVYPDRDTAFDLYDQNPLLAHCELENGLFGYSAPSMERDHTKYTVGAAYEAPVSLKDDNAFMAFGDTVFYDLSSFSRMYTFYVDDNMRLLSALYTYGLGVSVVTPDYTVFGVIPDTPDTSSALRAFSGLETVDCTLNVNSEDITLPLYTGIDNHIAVYADGATITASAPVSQPEGSSTSIPDGGTFTLDGPVVITVSY